MVESRPSIRIKHVQISIALYHLFNGLLLISLARIGEHGVMDRCMQSNTGPFVNILSAVYKVADVFEVSFSGSISQLLENSSSKLIFSYLKRPLSTILRAWLSSKVYHELL